LVLFCCARPAIAYDLGDLNCDGVVDVLDVDPFVLALVDPAGYAAEYPACDINLADMNGDGLANGGDIQPFVTTTTQLVPCHLGSKYAWVSKSVSATGSSAKIRTRSTTLCGEPTADTPAGSFAWAGVTEVQGSTPVKWIQIGYGRYRADTGPSTTVYYERYAETRAGPGPNDYDYKRGPTPDAGTHEYKCYLLSSLLNVVYYDYDGMAWYHWQHSGLRDWSGTDYQYEAEIWNREDQMVGTSSAKCNFTECKYAANWAMFENANITTGDVHTDDAAEWGIERVSSTAFNVCDKNP
jgi:hypothetical protein